MNGVLDSLSAPSTWEVHPFGGVFARRKVTGHDDLEPLSVFTGLGVVPRSSQDWSYKALGDSLAGNLLVEPGDLVFNKLRAWQGAVGLSEHRGIVSPAYFVCRARGEVDVRFFHYLLRSPAWVEEIKRLAKWMPPNQNDISWDQLKRLRVWVPPLKTQEAIADHLDRETSRIDGLIAKKLRMIQLLLERWEAGVAQAVTEGVDSAASRRAVKNLWVERIKEGWHVLPLRRRWSVIDCKHVTPEYLPAGFPLVSHGEIVDGQARPDIARHFVGEADYKILIEGRRPQSGDVIYTRNASIGNAGYVQEGVEFAMGQDVCLIRSQDQDQRFLTFFLNTLAKKQLAANRLGATFDRINVSQILDLEVPCPPPDEQREIADALVERKNSVDRVLDRLEQQVDLLAERRQALITAAVTGEMDIPGAAA